ncbi:MAG: Rne/Rng family ribonuclease, partial [Phycisphaerae bacterium]|nr:Rne/Rng family ribonuclease [Phycisphaerae bacterium]
MESQQNTETENHAPKKRPRRRPARKASAPATVTSSATPTEVKPEQIMVINVAEGDECRVAILTDGRLEELFIERTSSQSHVGNIYKGRVTNVEPSIQAAFVDFGLGKNGFLHISDLQPQYFPDSRGEREEVGRKTPRRERPPIQKCLRRGQELIVQITKEGIGTKGPTLTTYISLPGRYLVLMPGMNRLGVSRKIEDDAARRTMRELLGEMKLPSNMGFILRTAGQDRNKRELQRDLQYLQRLWKAVSTRIKNDRAPAELYRESDLVIRTIRDVYTSDFSKIIVDDPDVAQMARDFLSIVSPRTASVVELYEGTEPLFHVYGIEAEIERINSRHVPLLSGGSLVIDSTEALVAIDVNSGRFREFDDAEGTAHKINVEAADEIARQLRLRDLGGLVIIDFIDMRYEKNRRDVERALRDALKKHKERAKLLRMSQFGIIELTRQRQRPSIKRSMYQDCPSCRGTGVVKTSESIGLDVMRLLRLAVYHAQVAGVTAQMHPSVAFHVLNHMRTGISRLEAK